jgi:hypothetical protein
MIDYKIQNLDHNSTIELARETSKAMAHQVMQMTEKDKIDFFYNLLLETDNRTIQCYWIDFVSPYVD